jgi:hypothetical protein
LTLRGVTNAYRSARHGEKTLRESEGINADTVPADTARYKESP